MGLSDKPGDDRYDYTLARRVDDLERLLDHLGITEDVTLVVHDWGGMIGMAWAARHLERVARLVILNTAAFPLPSERPFHWPLKLTRTPLGGLLVKRLNAFAEVAARTCVTRRPMPKRVREAYTAPYDTPANRVATLRFVQDIPLGPGDRGYDIVAGTEAKLPRARDRPADHLLGRQGLRLRRAVPAPVARAVAGRRGGRAAGLRPLRPRGRDRGNRRRGEALPRRAPDHQLRCRYAP